MSTEYTQVWVHTRGLEVHQSNNEKHEVSTHVLITFNDIVVIDLVESNPNRGLVAGSPVSREAFWTHPSERLRQHVGDQA